MLRDRDLSGELKDIWGAIQAKRIREKDYSAPSYESYLASQNQIYIDFGPETAASQCQSDKVNELNQQQQQQQQLQTEQTQITQRTTNATKKCKNQSNSVLNVDEVDNNISSSTNSEAHQNTLNRLDTDMQSSTTTNNSEHRSILDNKDIHMITTVLSSSPPPSQPQLDNSDSNKNERPVTTSKKDKLGGFLPNGCHNIFPFIKTKSNSQDKHNNTHKEKHDSSTTNHKDQRLIQNNDTANLESEVSKLHIGKGQ